SVRPSKTRNLFNCVYSTRPGQSENPGRGLVALAGNCLAFPSRSGNVNSVGLSPAPAIRSLPDDRGSAAMLQPTRSASLLSLLLRLSGATPHAKPAYKKPLADYSAPTLAPPLNACRTCPLPDNPPPPAAGAGEYRKPHNPFGARLAAVGKELARAGKPN